jgi:Cu+-exporting ATPase
MTCGNCARHVTDALQATAGVASAFVDLNAGQATVEWIGPDRGLTVLLVESLRKAGYPARERIDLPDGRPSALPVASPWKASIQIGLPLAGIMGIADWGFGLGMNRVFQWISFVVAVAIVWLLGRQFYRGAWNQLRAGGSNMDTLVSLGVSAAMGYSIPALFAGWPGHLFFTETVTLLALVGTGHYLEHRMSARAGSALRALLELAPSTAWQLDPSGVEREVPVSKLVPGDRLLLRPGDRIPVDAQVITGTSAVDESMLTGESMPVEKTPGSALYTGTSNSSGRLIATVTVTGEGTALARIADVIRRAQSTRASVQRLADRISAIFVPIVVSIAIAAGIWWMWLPDSATAAHAVAERWLWHSHLPDSRFAAGIVVACAVLVIACPCAMGLATPVALMAGVNNAARRGILVRDAVALETCGTLDTLIFDKTGTLTEGRPVVVDQADLSNGIIGVSDPKVSVAEIAASMARRSTHPLSVSIARIASGDLQIEEWMEHPGAGLAALWQGQKLQLGSIAALEAAGIDITSAQAFIEPWLAKGATPVLLAADRRLIGAFALRDSLRPEAVAVVRRLRASGLRVGMLSGDHPRAAAAIAAEAGIDPAMVRAGVAPEGKALFLSTLKASGFRVAFVGDGINDGPALAAADLGIAVSRASDVAREAAGLVLLRPNLNAVADALDLAKATLSTIHQNLFWAFFYNAAAVPLAALGLVSPALCAAAMGLSDLVVVGNALRLARRK